MMRGTIIVVVTFYSIIFLKRRLYRHETTGIVIIILGITIVGLASVLYQAETAQDPVFGIILIFIGECFSGGMFVTEEIFLKNVKVDPLQAVGIEGLAGFTIYLICLPILNVIPCHDDRFCHDGYVENTIFAFHQMG